MAEWQPIETAPKDGSPVWAKATFVGQGNSYPVWVSWCDAWDGLAWYEAGSQSRVTTLTHWMPRS